MPDSVENLQIWKEGVSLVEAVYLATKPWPKEETYGLTSQIRRAAVSIPANLAEGIGRGTCLEAARFAQIALGSLYECDTLLVIAKRLGYIESDAVMELRDSCSRLCKQVSGFIAYQRERHDSK
ncbi:four helix bundle protein [Candidatus Bipolaricaulota bacterium]|jgi:four helix bundle protein|nr:four helix bundle protein [Candidatus Bipolaricaulota bacterium]TFH07386.1 MAG: four helix bundle protein [Candidatus Atribacteria bacterium]